MRTLVVVALVVGSLAVPPQNAVAANAVLPSNATIQVPGHGWGHGRGMGQWGAKGMADAGKTWDVIVKHYYSGTTIGTRAPENIRVLVERSPDVMVTSASAFTAVWSDGAKAATSSDAYEFLRARYDGTKYRVEKAPAWTGPWALVSARAMPVVFKPGTSMLQLVFGSGSIHYYRGNVIARYYSEDNMRSINDVSLEHYLRGVVPRESPASWPAESLKAQSVAARTYAVYKKDTARANGNMYDICATTMCQVYAGYAMKTSPSASGTVLEYASTNSAINATAGKVVLYGGKPILAEFSSSTGGYTAPGNVAYQKAVPDPGDTASPYHNWKATMKVSEIEAKWPEIGRLRDVKVTKRNGFGDWGGRVLEVQLIGTSTTKTISGYALRQKFEWPSRSNGVRSVWYRVLYWRGALASAPSSVSIVQGATRTVTVHVKNTGTASWSVGGPVRLATPSSSRFSGSGWTSATRAAEIVRNATDPARSSIAPGQVAEFRIPLHTDGVAPGSYTQGFSLVADGLSAMAMSFNVRVEVLVPWVEDAPNLVRDPSFESASSLWRGAGLVSGDGPTSAWSRQGARSMRLTAGANKSVSQTMNFAGGVSRRFTLGAWNRAAGTTASGGPIQVSATARYTDGTTSALSVPFARAPHLWTYDERSFVTSATKHLSSITIAATFAAQTGESFFDAVRLIETPVVNGSFEDGMTAWTPAGFASGDGASVADKHDGGRVLALTGSGSKSVSQTLAMSGARGELFVLSGWNRSIASDPVGGPIQASITLRYTDGTTSNASVAWATDAHDWTRREVAIRAGKAFTRATLRLSRSAQTGTQYFDDVRLSRTYAANGSFENDLLEWTTSGFEPDDRILPVSFPDGGKSLRLEGSGSQAAYQQIAKSGGAGHKFTLSAWSTASGTDPNGGLVGIRVVFRNTDGSSSIVPLSFGQAPHRWTFTEHTVKAPRQFSRVDLYVTFSKQTGSSTFDGIVLRNA